MPQQPDILSVLDDVQASPTGGDDRAFAKAWAASFPAVGDRPDYYKGVTFARRDLQKLANQMGVGYDTARRGVQARGGALNDGGPGSPDVLSVLDDVQAAAPPADNRSLFARAFDAVFTPPEFVTRAANRIANTLDPALTLEEAEAINKAPHVFGIPLSPRAARSYAAGVVQGAANLLTPGDAALAVTGAEAAQPAIRAIGGARAVEAARTLQRGANAAIAARGLERTADAESIPEAAAGVAQMALGAAGVRGGAHPVEAPAPARELPALPPGAKWTVAPDGRVVPVGTDIPMAPAADGSFVRGVPAEYARREIRGELPPGPAFIADDAGRVAAAADRDVLAALDVVQGRQPAPDASGVRSVRPAVLERDVDATVPAREGVTVRQYASDPNATDAPFISDEERRVLKVMRNDLQEFTPQRGRLVRDPNDPNSDIYARGGPGSPVGDDIRVISEQNVGNDKIAQAIDDLLAGNAPTNRLHTAAIDAARGYLEGRPGYRGPVLPLEGEVSRGGEPVAIDDFDQFSRMFDDVEPSPHGEPGESGFIAPQLAQHVAGGVAGAVYGGATGEDEQDRLKRAALFGLAGAAAPALLRRGGGQAASRAVRAYTDPPGTVIKVPERVPRVGRSGEQTADPMAGVDAFLGKFSNPLVQEGIKERLVTHSGFAEQRRGNIGTRELGKFAHQVQVDVTRVLPKGTAVSGEVITAYARAAQETQKRVQTLAELVNSGKATDADVVALAAAQADADVVLKSLMGLRTEAGRALQTFRQLDTLLGTGRVDLIRGAAAQLREDAQKFAASFGQQPSDPLTRYRWLQQQGLPTWRDRFSAYWYASLLSGVATHERNIIGNISNAIAGTVAHPFAAGIDAARSAVTGKPREVLFSELPRGVVGMYAGMEQGLSDALFTLRHGVNPTALDKSLKAAAVGKLDVPRVEFGGGAVNPLNWPSRSLDAADAFFRSAARSAELYESAYTLAKREGKTGQALEDRMAQLTSGATPEGAALREQAENVAARAVFQEKGGPITSWLAQGYRVPVFGTAMQVVIPFLRTPGNIIRQGLEVSPAGFGMKAARQGGRLGTLAQGKAAAGSFAAGYLAWLAATGRLSGDGPQNAAERAALMESGWRPNSIRVGDSWVSYQPLQPISVQAALIANAVEAWTQNGAKAEDAADVAAETFARATNSFLDQTFLQGAFDLVEALKDPERSASRIVGRTAQGLVPFSGAMRTAQRAMDPTVRQPRSITEQVASGLPGVSESVPARIDRFGREVQREGGPVRHAADPFNVSSVVSDPVAQELDRLGVSLSVPSGRLKVDGRSLTREESDELKRRQGQAVRAALEQETSRPRYPNMPEDRQRERLEAVINRARRDVNEQYRRELIGRRRASLESANAQ